MSRPRFLADHDFNEHIISGVLRREPVLEITRARHVDLDDRPDREVLEQAAALGLIVLTHDVNTMTKAAYERISSGLPMAGLFPVSQAVPVAEVIDDLLLVWAASEAEEWKDVVQHLPL
jgi:hypothetical protein